MYGKGDLRLENIDIPPVPGRIHPRPRSGMRDLRHGPPHLPRGGLPRPVPSRCRTRDCRRRGRCGAGSQRGSGGGQGVRGSRPRMRPVPHVQDGPSQCLHVSLSFTGIQGERRIRAAVRGSREHIPSWFRKPHPPGLSFVHASLSEIIACCINAQNNTLVREGDSVLVLGSGPAGIIHTQLARKAGAGKVMLSQRSRPRLDLAVSRFPVDRAIASSEEDLEKAVMEETRGEGADVAFVCAPSAEAQEMAIRLTAPRGRINFFGGLPKGGSTVSVDANVVHYKELLISGASSSLPEGKPRGAAAACRPRDRSGKTRDPPFSDRRNRRRFRRRGKQAGNQGGRYLVSRNPV